MKTYKVTWENELSSDNPLQAAKDSKESITNGRALMFEVFEIDEDGEVVSGYFVDLLECNDNAVLEM